MTPKGALERRDRLRLARTQGVGPVAWRELMGRYGSASRALEVLPDLARRGGRSGPLQVAGSREAEQEIAAGEALGAQLLTVGERGYPARLAAVDPPPPVLWARGEVALLSRPTVAVVGARIASAAGQRFARTLAADLAQAGYVVVSGLARGVDGAAHEGALDGGTVAVLAGGVDDVYPPEHAPLYEAIAQRGCVVSENAVGRRATARDFPRRNRIISGLSLGVVVVEAEARSGSLITARLAAEQGREVFAVPGSPLDPRAKGPNQLLRQGAALCEGAGDVIAALSAMGSAREPQLDLFDRPAPDHAALDAAADRLRERAYALLSLTPAPCDEIVRSLGEPAPGVLAALVELSLAGRADLLPGGLVAAPTEAASPSGPRADHRRRCGVGLGRRRWAGRHGGAIMSNPRDPERDHPLDSGRAHSHATENDNINPNAANPPRPATEPQGAEHSTKTDKTLTDPATGHPQE